MTTEKEVKQVSKTELGNLMKEMAAEQFSEDKISAAVEKAIAPLKEQTTDWMNKIKATATEKDVLEKGTKGIGAARWVRAMAASKGDPTRAAAFAKKAWSDGLGDVIEKSLLAGDFTAGGALIPPALAAEVIELLRAKTVVRAAGPRVVPMPRGTISFRTQTGATSATYVGESTDITKTQPTVGQITLTARKLAALVPISNDLLLYDADVTADAFVRDDLVKVLSIKEDATFLRGTGLSDTPRGLRYWAQAANVNGITSSWSTTAAIESDLMGLITKLEVANVDMDNTCWFMAPRTKNAFRTLRNTNGFLVFPNINDAQPTLYGRPVYTSTNMPANLGAGTDAEIFFVGMSDVLIGESGGLSIDVSPDASYIDGSLVSSFSRDETVIRAIMRHDLGVRHTESLAVLTGVNK